MELRHLRYFVAIAEERSFTRAAERLWVAQPGLSSQIRRLEAEIGVQLFDRHSRGVDLTDAGKVFLERARVTLTAADSAVATARDLATGVVGTVKLGIATCARWRATSTLLDLFGREHEGVELTILEGYGGTLWRDLRDGRLDAVIAPSCFASADLRRVELGAEPWVVLVGAAHELAGSGPLSASDLDGQQIAVTAHRDGAGYDRAVAGVLAELEIAGDLVRRPAAAAWQASLSGGGSLMLTTAPDALCQDVTARPLEPRVTLPFALMSRDEEPSPALGEFLRVGSDCIKPTMPSRPTLVAVA